MNFRLWNSRFLSGCGFFLLVLGFAFSGIAETTKEEQKLFEFGQKAMRDGLYELAESKFQALLTQFPQTEFLDEATFLGAQARLNQGRWQEALEFLQPRLNEVSEVWQDDYLFLIGEARLKGDQPLLAFQTFESLIEKFPKSRFILEARYGLARALLQQQKLAPAQEMLKELQKDAPRELAARASLSLGMSLILQGKYDQASVLLSKLARDERKNAVGFQAVYALGEM
jgi:TolA-binding protein